MEPDGSVGSPAPERRGAGIRLGLLWLVGCGAAQYRNVRPDVVTLDVMDSDYTPRQVAELLERNSVQLIDVREPREFEGGRIAGARLLPLDELAAQAETIDRGRQVVFYCRSGARSAMATQAFRGAGFDAHNMAGGLLGWDAAGLPLEPDGGYVVES
jgi:rhodanese-related sulfurtransferase